MSYYEAHIVTSRELYHDEGQQHLMKSKRAKQKIEAKLRAAKAAAVASTASVGRKRKAADHVEQDFYSGARPDPHTQDIRQE
jgi:hypothetical protein